MIDTTTLDPAPALSSAFDQPREALLKANEVRLKQAELKRRIKAGQLHLDAVLIGTADLTDEELDAFDRMEVAAFLCAARLVGPTRLRKILTAAVNTGDPRRPLTLATTKRLVSLTVWQRHKLAKVVREYVPHACTGGEETT